MNERDKNMLFPIIYCFIITWILILLSGCTDNRIRIKPKTDIRLSVAKEAELRLYVLWSLHSQAVMKESEIWMKERK